MAKKKGNMTTAKAIVKTKKKTYYVEQGVKKLLKQMKEQAAVEIKFEVPNDIVCPLYQKKYILVKDIQGIKENVHRWK